MKTQQQFYLYKFSSGRIIKANYNIKINIDEARKNGELITVGQNQAIMSLFDLQGKTFDREYIDRLFSEKRKIKNKKASFENYQRLAEIENKITDILFVPEIISVLMDNKTQYKNIIENSFFVNGNEYVRLLCGAGHARHNTVIFVSKNFELPLKNILNNGHKDIEIIPAKMNAYFALTFSGTVPVSEPYFCVIPDYEIQREEKVDLIEENGDNVSVVETNKLIDFNIFDGQGLISPRLAKIWAKDLDIDDYIPSAFIIRNSFLKGMVCTFDFNEYALDIGKRYIKDVWGNTVDIRNMDIILTASQFKMWSAYESCQHYIDNCRKNNMTWGVSRVAPKEDNSFVFSNYQFLQVLNLNKDQIKNLCSKTISYFNGIIKDDVRYTLLYLLGEQSNKQYDENIYHKTNDIVTKALILDNNLIKDPYIRKRIFHSLDKKIKESYIGNLILNGNYTIITIDPVAFIQYALGLPVEGILKRGEYYCDFWNRKNVNKVAACRAPLTWRSEINVLPLKNNDNTEKYYSYMKNGVVIYNVHGCDMMIHADADADGDIVMLTDQKEFIDGAFGGNPVTYDKKKAEKIKVDESELYKVDMLSFDSKIGFITNCSTTMYAMLSIFDENTNVIENKELIDRLKICRRLQGDQIDLAKGIKIKPFPRHWVKWTNLASAKNNADIDNINLNNKLIIDKRPYFMRWLYANKNRLYNKHNWGYDNISTTNLRMSLNDLLDKYNYDYNNCTDNEKVVAENYYRFNPLLDSDCVANNICHYLENSIKKTNKLLKDVRIEDKTKSLQDRSIPYDAEKEKKLYDLYIRYKKEKRNYKKIKDDGNHFLYQTIEQYNKFIRNEAYKISSNINELANLAIGICYIRHENDSKDFAWSIFGEGIINNILKNKSDKSYVPFLDENGPIEFLGKRYRMFEININRDDIERYFDQLL